MNWNLRKGWDSSCVNTGEEGPSWRSNKMNEGQDWGRKKLINGIVVSTSEQLEAISLLCPMAVPVCLVLVPHSPAYWRKSSSLHWATVSKERKSFPLPKEQAHLIRDFCWQCLKPMELIGTLVSMWGEREDIWKAVGLPAFLRIRGSGANSPLSLVSLSFSVYRGLALPLLPGEGGCYWDTAGRNLESTPVVSQSVTQRFQRLQGGARRVITAVIFQGGCWVRRINKMLQKTDYFTSFLIILLFSQFLPLSPRNPPSWCNFSYVMFLM